MHLDVYAAGVVVLLTDLWGYEVAECSLEVVVVEVGLELRVETDLDRGDAGVNHEYYLNRLLIDIVSCRVALIPVSRVVPTPPLNLQNIQFLLILTGKILIRSIQQNPIGIPIHRLGIELNLDSFAQNH